MSPTEKPRKEPEIIQPNDTGRQAGRGEPRMRIFIDTRGTERIYIAKPSPLGAILVILMIGILSAVFLALLSAAFLIAIPVMVLLVTTAIIAGLIRAYFWPQP
jgi:hypothetical protein